MVKSRIRNASQPKVKAKPVKVEAVGTVGQSGSEYDWSINNAI
jgi:hypothetical protein